MSIRDHLYHYPVLHYDVYDGDTVKVVLDLGFSIPLGISDKPRTWYSVRINGVDTPEKRGDHERAAGKAVTAVVKSLLVLQDCQLVVKSIQLGKYAGRFIGDIVMDNDALLSEFLLKNGFAKPYEGGTKQVWTTEELKEVIKKCDIWLTGSDE